MKINLSTIIPLFALSTAIIYASESAPKAACCAAPPPASDKAVDGACCQPTPKPVVAEPDACCASEQEVAPYSELSIYQLDAKFTNDSGKSFDLGDLRGRPVVLDMFFASCGYACPLTVTDMLAIQGRLPANLRDQVKFVLVSFDVARDTPAVLAQYRAQRALGPQWVLLHGDDNSVRELAALLGVKFKQMASGAFSHSNLLTILNTKGEIVHQREGLSGGLSEASAALAAATK